MILDPKYILRSILFFSGLTLTFAQYQPTDFNASQLIDDQLRAPGRITVDANDNIYVVDVIKYNIKKYDAQGNFVETIITPIKPSAIAVNDKNDLLIADKLSGDIFKLKNNGSLDLLYSGLDFPSDMIYGDNKVLYVVDSRLKKVVGLDKFGNVVLEFSHSAFVYPSGITYDPINEHLIVSEHGGIGGDVQTCGGGCSLCWGSSGPQTKIYIFDLAGTLQTDFGCFGTSDGLFQRIQGMAVDSLGNIFATDPYLGRVSVFDSLGTYITKFGQHGNYMGEFNLPVDIAFTSDNRILVPSMNKGSIDVFTIGTPLKPSSEPVASELNENGPEEQTDEEILSSDTISIYPNPSNGEITVRIQSEDPLQEDASIQIYTMTGQRIFSEAFDPKTEYPNNTTIYRNITIKNFSNGIYIIHINAGDLVSQEKLVLKK